jgi:UDPglucose--hexose-1-phosphate uridylyltransferase
MGKPMNVRDDPHKRLNLLTGEWVLVSPHRTKRPWQGKVEETAPVSMPQYEPSCYLCPGNERAGGLRTPRYYGTYVFDNDFAALLGGSAGGTVKENGLLVARGERGVCRVICFSPRHDLTLALMDRGEIGKVVDVWAEQYRDLGAIDFIKYVQIFENRGAIMGCSNPHPHGQVWANETVPDLPAREQQFQTGHRTRTGRCLLCDYLELERSRGERVVFENDSFTVLVPYWAVWPFETMVVSREHARDITALGAEQKSDLADILRRMGIRYDNLFRTSFPYSMGIHQAPCDGAAHEEWHLHLHYLPPLLRSANVKKFMVGYELLAMPQRDITAESSAARLRECAETHFTRKD